MKLLAASPAEVDLQALIERQVQGDYIYMYPPRQAYRPWRSDMLEMAIRASLSETETEPVNLYLHFPFCEQICGFCNLFTTMSDGREDEQTEYVVLLERELAMWRGVLGGRRIATIYLGGGTPSLFPPSLLDRCLRAVERQMGTDRSGVSEVALEIAPMTVDESRLASLRDIGITRINMGLQTTSDKGLRAIGRKHDYANVKARIASAVATGFDNVCVDLIYGLPAQSSEEWCQAVDEVAALGADTVCAYPLTARPYTPFAQFTPTGGSQYEKYDYAREKLTSIGMVQETHVRYIAPGSGGYLQKVNHWKGQDIVGVGAGARGYLRAVDYRNRYSVRHRKGALTAYAREISDRRFAFDSGLFLQKDEQMRRSLILGLLALDRGAFEDAHGVDALFVFERELLALMRLGLAQVDELGVALTDNGRKYRDLAVQSLFSTSTWDRIAAFDYNE